MIVSTDICHITNNWELFKIFIIFLITKLLLEKPTIFPSGSMAPLLEVVTLGRANFAIWVNWVFFGPQMNRSALLSKFLLFAMCLYTTKLIHIIYVTVNKVSQMMVTKF